MATLVWFRQDLRLADNPALAAAIAAGGPVIPVFLHTPAEEGTFRPGAASRWWLQRSLGALDRQLRAAGSRLCIRAGGESLALLRALVKETGASRVLWNRRYEPAAVAHDRRLKTALRADGLEVESYNGALLHEPWTVCSASGTPYQVFTPFWRRCRSLPDPAEPLPAPTALAAPAAWPDSQPLEELALAPRASWMDGLAAAWTPGAAAADRRLQEFLHNGYPTYESNRDLPGSPGTSRLSPHLHFGELGPRQIWHAVRAHAGESGTTEWRDSKFLAELGWREFACHVLFNFPAAPEQPLQARYADFPWRSDPRALAAWQRGETGYPIVDAGMRELWHTGWMHNRVRMITASFLVKDLLLPWMDGARWFWDTLVDADLASNTLGWQWVAGCGADAAPFHRIFNPVAQGIRFDADGTYVRRWVPELKLLPDEWLHRPWAASASIRQTAYVSLGVSYPRPLVDHDIARREALEAARSLRP